MAINKKLIHFKTKAKFNEELAAGNILDTSIVFIKDAKQIYTHGQLYDCNEIMPYMYYDISNTNEGMLISTDIAAASNEMVTMEIKGNSYSTNGPIDTIIQFCAYGTDNSIISATAFNNGFKLGPIKAFVHEGVIKLWMTRPAAFCTLFVTALTQHSPKINHITNITQKSMPTSGVTQEITITPKDVLRPSGTSSQFMMADGSAKPITDITTSINTNISNKVNKAGDTMTGALTVPKVNITGTSNSTANLNSDSATNAFISVGGKTLTTWDSSRNAVRPGLDYNNQFSLGIDESRWSNVYANTINVTSQDLVANLNADKLDGYHAGVKDNQVALYIAFPNFEVLINKGYLNSDYTNSHPDEEYFKALVKWAIDTYPTGANLMGSVNPNSVGLCHIHLYSSKHESGYPNYCSGVYYGLNGHTHFFGTSQGTWKWDNGLLHGISDSAVELNQTKTIWGQPFNGTNNVTGELTGVTNITMSGDIKFPNTSIHVTNSKVGFFKGELATPILTGGILASGNYSDASKIPTNGIYSDGEVIGNKFTKKGGTATQFLKADGSVDSNTYALSAKSITYSALVTARNGSNLIPGTWYRITDYQCTTTQEGTSSANHQFDILVLATNVNTLSEEARAIQHESDTYFANSKLNAWKIWYCLDNDTTKFAWADSTNGKGVIYRMIDEFNNECGYDFKNIKFSNGYYTFTYATIPTWTSTTLTFYDGSLNSSTYVKTFFCNNQIKQSFVVDESTYTNKQQILDFAMTRCIILEADSIEQESLYRIENNIIDNSTGRLYNLCYNNQITNSKVYSTFIMSSEDGLFTGTTRNNIIINSTLYITYCDDNTIINFSYLDNPNFIRTVDIYSIQNSHIYEFLIGLNSTIGIWDSSVRNFQICVEDYSKNNINHDISISDSIVSGVINLYNQNSNKCFHITISQSDITLDYDVYRDLIIQNCTRNIPTLKTLNNSQSEISLINCYGIKYYTSISTDSNYLCIKDNVNQYFPINEIKLPANVKYLTIGDLKYTADDMDDFDPETGTSVLDLSNLQLTSDTITIYKDKNNELIVEQQ